MMERVSQSIIRWCNEYNDVGGPYIEPNQNANHQLKKKEKQIIKFSCIEKCLVSLVILRKVKYGYSRSNCLKQKWSRLKPIFKCF